LRKPTEIIAQNTHCQLVCLVVYRLYDIK